MEAARSLFARQGFDAVSIRAVAQMAGVNTAMIHYYFGNKQGLYEAVLSGTLDPLIQELGDALATDAPTPVRRFLSLYIHTLGANPWLPPLLLREVLSEDGRLRGWFLQQFESKAGLITRFVQREQTAGRMRPDADATFTALSLLSLAVFPFVATPAGSDAAAMRVRKEQLDRLVDHTERLFLDGLST